MLQDWRVAVRSVARRRGLALAIVFTLTLGIGANTAIFSAIDAVLLKPLPYPASDRLVALYEVNATERRSTSLVAPVRLEEWQRLNRSFDGLAGSYFENMTDTTGPLPERVTAMRTSPRFFAVLGTEAALGRTTTPAEEAFGGPSAVVVSDGFWRGRLDADPAVIGRVLTLAGQRRTIVGVMPPAFRYPTAATEAWVPAQMSAGLLQAREARFFTAVGRLKAGVTPEQAREDLGAIQARLGELFPRTDKGWSASVLPLKEEQVGGVRRSLWVLFGAVLLVLLAACGNVACLLLADGLRREHEVAVRFALGASRRAIVRQLLLEGLVLSIAGSLAGLLIARWGIAALRVAATQLPRAAELRMDARLVTFTIALAVATTMLFALAPALQATRRDVAERLARGARGQVGGRPWLQRALVTAQVSLAIVLLVCAGLLVRSFSHLQQVSPGFDPTDVLTFRMSAAWSEKPEAVVNRQVQMLQRLMAIPGVTGAALNTLPPGSGDFPPTEFTIAGRQRDEHYFAIWRTVSADYFATLRIPVLQGQTCRDDPRAVGSGDDTSSGSGSESATPPRFTVPAHIVISRALAERFFPGENPIGQRIGSGSSSREIVGVVGDVRERGLMRDPEPTLYRCGLMPYWPDPYYIVRTDSSRAVTMTAIREALREIEPGRAVYGASTLTDQLSASLSQPRLNTVLLALFATMALLLAAIGLYGLLAQFVSQRRREIGLRMALGARPSQVLAQILRYGAIVTTLGVAIGLAGALVLARFMATLLFGIASRDPLTFTLVPLLLALIAAVATFIPARRAIRVDPMQALRDE